MTSIHMRKRWMHEPQKALVVGEAGGGAPRRVCEEERTPR